jgi:hypothetical protein
MKISVENSARSGDTAERMPAHPDQRKRARLGLRRQDTQAGLHFLTRQLSFFAIKPLISISRAAFTLVAEKGS